MTGVNRCLLNSGQQSFFTQLSWLGSSGMVQAQPHIGVAAVEQLVPDVVHADHILRAFVAFPVVEEGVPLRFCGLLCNLRSVHLLSGEASSSSTPPPCIPVM